MGYYWKIKNDKISKGLFPGTTPTQYNVTGIQIGGPFELTDHNDNRISSTRDYAGKAMIIYFGFTNCPDVCPEELEKLTKIMSRIQRNFPKKYSKLKTIFITCDPERDNPSELKGYLKDFHPDIIGLTGSAEEIKQVAKKFRAYFSINKTSPTDYLVDHSTVIYLMDKQGNFVKHFGKNTSIEECVDEIVKLI